MKVFFFLAAALCLALPAAAQKQKPAPPPTASAAPVASGDRSTSPELSELYQVKLENLNLRGQNLQQQFETSPQMQQLRSEYAALMDRIQKAYPGYQYDSHANRLIKLPGSTPAPPAPTPAPVKK